MADELFEETTPRRRHRGWWGLVLLVVLALVAGACGDDDDAASTGTTTASESQGDASSAGNKDPYQIAYIGPLSGTLGGLGTTQLKALTSLVDSVNAEGGVNGHQIELVSEDDANDPAKGIAAARKLTSEGVLGIIGPPVSSIVEAVLPTTSRAGVSIITPGATPTALNPAQPTLFQVDQTSASQAQPMLEFAEALLEKSSFKTSLGPIDTPSGLAWAENVKKLADMKSGIDVLSSTPIPVAPGDVTVQAQKLTAGNPDIILMQMTDVPFVSMIQKLRDLGYDGPVVNFHGGSSANVFNTLKDPNVYAARTYNHYDEAATEPGLKAFVEAAKKAGTAQTAQSASLYGSVYVGGLALLGAIEECGDDCTPQKVTDALNNLDFDTEGLTPENLTFTKTNHQTMNTNVFWHWDGSKPAVALDGQVFKGSVYSLEEK